MKKIIAAFIAFSMIIMTATSCDPVKKGGDDVNSSVTEEYKPHKFGRDDLKMKNGVAIGMTVEQVEAIMGEADSKQTFPENDFIYGKNTELEYGDLSLRFFDVNGGDDLTLGTIYSISESDIFAGGLHVNSTKDDVLEAFTKAEEELPLYFDNSGVSYGSYIYGDINENLFTEKKPQGEQQFAYINRFGEDTEYMMEYYYWEPIHWLDDGEGYMGGYYSIVFYMNSETDLVNSIALNFDYRI